jgi:hypothetical protein
MNQPCAGFFPLLIDCLHVCIDWYSMCAGICRAVAFSFLRLWCLFDSVCCFVFGKSWSVPLPLQTPNRMPDDVDRILQLSLSDSFRHLGTWCLMMDQSGQSLFYLFALIASSGPIWHEHLILISHWQSCMQIGDLQINFCATQEIELVSVTQYSDGLLEASWARNPTNACWRSPMLCLVELFRLLNSYCRSCRWLANRMW